jgi:uncharacterized protein YbjT (DUF2867 family)
MNEPNISLRSVVPTLSRYLILLFSVLALGSGSAAALEGPILVFGGTAGIGLETVKVLRERDIPVTVFVRPTSDRTPLEPLGVSYAVGNALNDAEVAAAFSTGDFAAVVSSLGGRHGEPRPEHIGNVNIDNAAGAAGVRRVIQISAISAGRDRDRAEPGEDAHWMSKMIYVKIQGEKHLMDSGLDYTILRPGLLQDEAATGDLLLTTRTDIAGSINRADVALLIVDLLGDDSSIGKAYNVIDKNMERPFKE